MRRVLELGSYVAPAYAGMILAEQGYDVHKWTDGKDPILSLHRGNELWEWINHDKLLVGLHPRSINEFGSGFDIVFDNFRPGTLEKWAINPAELAEMYDLIWVSLRSEVGERSFDVIAQARSWMEYAAWVPFYVGDTAAGLWMAFKALAVEAPGHYTIGQASCLQKLVEGELVIDAPRDTVTAWDMEPYYANENGAMVKFKGDYIFEPVRDREWKLEHLWHNGGRMRI